MVRFSKPTRNNGTIADNHIYINGTMADYHIYGTIANIHIIHLNH
jgi:hypothetical protein